MISKKVIVILGVMFAFASIGILLVVGLVIAEINKVSNNPEKLMSITQNHPLTIKFLEKHPNASGGMTSSCSFGECHNTGQYQTQTFEIFRVESLRFSFDKQNQISDVVLECIDTHNPSPSLQSITVKTPQDIEEFECI